MVFKDINPVDEINEELRDFRKEFRGTNIDKNQSLILKGGRITQHLAEYLYRCNSEIEYNIYDNTLDEWLNDYVSDFIPIEYRKLLFAINNYRMDVFRSREHLTDSDIESLDLKLYKIISDFLEIFKGFLIWFKNYHENELSSQKKGKIKEINTTINLLNNGQNLENTLISPNQNLMKVIYILEQNQIEMNSKVDNLTIKVNDTNERVIKLDKKVDFIKEYVENIAKNQEDIKEKLEEVATDEELDKIMKKFSNECANQFIARMKNNTADEEYTNERRKLISSLGKNAWNKLSESSQTFLITSKITYNRLNIMENAIDYSGVCILVVKALENELVKRFSTKFGKYLKKKYGKNYSQFHTSLLGYNPETKKSYLLKKKNCTLGTISYILNNDKDKKLDDTTRQNNLLKLIEYSKKQLMPNLNDEEIEEKLKEYEQEIDNIRKKYRNPSAHPKQLQKIDAKECFDLVLDVEKFLKKMLDSFKY